MLTNGAVSVTILPGTMAEVAPRMSTAQDQAIAGEGKGQAPKDMPVPTGHILGLHKICAGLSSCFMMER